MVAVAGLVLVGGGRGEDPSINSTVLTPAHFRSFHLATWAVDFGAVDDEPLMYPQYPWDEEVSASLLLTQLSLSFEVSYSNNNVLLVLHALRCTGGWAKIGGKGTIL